MVTFPTCSPKEIMIAQSYFCFVSCESTSISNSSGTCLPIISTVLKREFQILFRICPYASWKSMFTQKRALNRVLVGENFSHFIVFSLATCHSTCMKFLSIDGAIKLGKAGAEAIARVRAAREELFIEKRFDTKDQSHCNHTKT